MKFLWIFLTIIVLLGGVIVKRMSVYPFTAIVGQDDMKMSLILNVINPSLGGVLIKGEKGTARSMGKMFLCYRITSAGLQSNRKN